MARKRSADQIACPECGKDIKVGTSISPTLLRLESAAMAWWTSWQRYVHNNTCASGKFLFTKRADLEKACAAHAEYLTGRKRG